jgi:NAD(P)-dependent dehydrogenase (short-subunit alcohol dehydrogenase family)
MPAPVIIFTGVSRGIGRAIAEELESRSADVVLTRRRRPVGRRLPYDQMTPQQQEGYRSLVETVGSEPSEPEGLRPETAQT